MSSSPSNKRKASGLRDEGGKRPPPALRRDGAAASGPRDDNDELHLPAPVWGHVLDFMPYDEVRSALLVGKIIANEAVKYLHVLNIMMPCQMDGPSARKFPNIEEVNILCLVCPDGESVNGLVLCKETCARIVPFVISLPKVKRIFAGGLDGRGRRLQYVAYLTSSPKNHRAMIRSLIDHVLGVYKTRLMPTFIESLQSICDAALEVGSDDWDFCHDLCSYFPIGDLLVCAAFRTRFKPKALLEIISKRPGALEIMPRFSCQYLVDMFLQHEIRYFDIGSDGKELQQRLSELGVEIIGLAGIQYLTTKDLENLDELIEVGFDPKSISREKLYSKLGVGEEDREFDMFAKSTFDALVSRGFAFEEKDLIILDEHKEPALKALPALIRGIED